MRGGGRRWRWLAVGLLGLALGAAAAGWFAMHSPLNADAPPRVFRVERGRSFAAVRRALAEQGFVSARAPLTLWARLTGSDRQIQEGEYEISAAQSPREILATLVAGRRLQLRVTIPEGWTQARILAHLAAELSIPEDSLRRAAADAGWLGRLGLARPSLEGYLHPETYLFERGLPARRVLEALVEAGIRLRTPARLARADSLGWNWHAVLTLASIVEAETARAEERPRIAAVYHDRLARGWLLQADPTVAFALEKPASQLTTEDLLVDSPFNTYRYPGLPPGPIGSPGEASVEAVLWPEEGFGALYFVARGDGTHTFSRTLAEHNRARRELHR